MKRDPDAYEGPRVTLDENVADFVRARDAYLALPAPERSQNQANDLVIQALSIARNLVGSAIVEDAFSCGDNLSRPDGLALLAKRQLLLSMFTAALPTDDYDAFAVAREALAVAGGDKPVLFGQTTPPNSKRVAVREMHCRMHALMWEEYLKALGVAAAERRHAIIGAFGEWDKIQKWKRSVPRALGLSWAEYRLKQATAAGQRGAPLDLMRRGESWQEALKREKTEYLLVQAQGRG